MLADEILDLVPELRDRRGVEPLPGGLTNTNYKVTTSTGSYVVRVAGRDTSLLAIDRENEVHNTIAAAEVGIGARVVAYLPEHGALVLEFIEGRTQSAEDLRRGDKLHLVAAACRRLHTARRFRDDFNMFEIQRRLPRDRPRAGLSAARALPRVRAAGASAGASDARSRGGNRAL